MHVDFKLVSPYQPAGDQPAAIEKLTALGEESLTEIPRMAQ